MGVVAPRTSSSLPRGRTTGELRGELEMGEWALTATRQAWPPTGLLPHTAHSMLSTRLSSSCADHGRSGHSRRNQRDTRAAAEGRQRSTGSEGPAAEDRQRRSW